MPLQQSGVIAAGANQSAVPPCFITQSETPNTLRIFRLSAIQKAPISEMEIGANQLRGTTLHCTLVSCP